MSAGLTTADGRYFRLLSFEDTPAAVGGVRAVASVELPTTDWPALLSVLGNCTLNFGARRVTGVTAQVCAHNIRTYGPHCFDVELSWRNVEVTA